MSKKVTYNGIVYNGVVPELQLTYSRLPKDGECEKDGWMEFSSLLTHDEFAYGKVELPEDGERYEVFDATLCQTFIAEYESHYKVFTDTVLNQSIWITAVNDEVFNLEDVTKWRKI